MLPPLRPDTLGLYISIPFCRSKCSFCNFASGVYPASHHGRYVERLCEELRGARRHAEAAGAYLPANVDSIYLGGGTPSVLEPALLRQLFATIRAEFRVSQDAEITMECAPGQIGEDILAAMAECGVNRVSLGVQSFIDREAAATGRLHNRATAHTDISRLRRAGIERLNIDLIAGLPDQTLASWRESLAALTGTGVEHASVYTLEVDEGSRLGKEMLDGGVRYHAGAVPKDDTIAAMFEIAAEHLDQAQIVQYEISNHAVPGLESKHNLKYWMRQPYLGLGLDAHSMLRHSGNSSMRFSDTNDLDAFLASSKPWQPEVLTPRAELEEAWFLGLRLTRGVWFDDLRAAYGSAETELYIPRLRELAADGLLIIDDRRAALTPRGRLISNDVFQAILEAGDEELCLS